MILRRFDTAVRILYWAEQLFWPMSTLPATTWYDRFVKKIRRLIIEMLNVCVGHPPVLLLGLVKLMISSGLIGCGSVVNTVRFRISSM